MDNCLGYNEFVMLILWFEQIGDTIEVLGQGHSGDIAKVFCHAEPVALKTFTLPFDDSSSLESVYEHELELEQGFCSIGV